MKYLVAFGRFWWSFVIGDDWTVAAGVGIAVGVTAALAHHGLNVWWLLPLAVVVILAASLWRVTKS